MPRASLMAVSALWASRSDSGLGSMEPKPEYRAWRPWSPPSRCRCLAFGRSSSAIRRPAASSSEGVKSLRSVFSERSALARSTTSAIVWHTCTGMRSHPSSRAASSRRWPNTSRLSGVTPIGCSKRQGDSPCGCCCGAHLVVAQRCVAFCCHDRGVTEKLLYSSQVVGAAVGAGGVSVPQGVHGRVTG
ncbi:Uncharacterised protein [Mycobacterium tuberculosis]|nr:Uncharacterised protein [Mycobacterium tuberculosis]